MADSKRIWRYRDLFLSIDLKGSAYTVTGRFKDEQKDADLQVPISPEEIAGLWAGKGSAQAIGKKIHGAVFSRGVLELLALAERSLLPWEGLRLRFRAGSVKVSEWPFETLHDRNGFLALRKDRLIVRYQGPPKAVRTLWGPRPLRILVVVSNPPLLVPLDVEEEWKKIQDALEPLRRRKKVEIERRDTPTSEELAAELGRKRYHVLHFIGHGKFNPDEDGGFIYLGDRDPDGNNAPVPGSKLAVLLADYPSIRLVVLNTCEGALARGESFSGVAQDLIRQKIPAVLAMQAKIPDAAAVRFSQWFYERLAKGRPIDRALRKVRYELFVAGVVREADWAMPVLYLGAKNGKLFTWLPSCRTILAGLLILTLGFALWRIKPWKPRCPTSKAVDMEFVRIELAQGPPFCLGAHEVSRGEWKAVMGANSLPKDQRDGDDLPVGVSVSGAEAFIDKLNAREGKRVYRLPNEVEWDHAAMGPGLSQEGNCLHGDAYEGLAPVGSFRTNDWGLYDMVGNVWEWVEVRGVTGEERVRRGGASDSGQSNCGVTARKSLDASRNQSNTGFRVLREIPK